jgi:dethiobiotin synthetase
MSQRTRGIFVIGTDTGVGKTYVAALIARQLQQAGRNVGVYKPVASGCRREGKTLVSDDAVALWQAVGQPGTLAAVCPQRFEAPLAPPLAAKAEGREVDSRKLRTGLDYWLKKSEIVVVEGAGGLMSPLSETEYVLDLAAEFQFPLVVVAANRLGTINHTLLTLIAAAAYADSLRIAGVVLNDVLPPDADDVSRKSNLAELKARCVPPVLVHVKHGAPGLGKKPNWWELAGDDYGD